MDYFTEGLGYDAWRDLGISLALLAGAVLAGLAAHWLLFWILSRFSGRTRLGWDDLALRYARPPLRLFLPLFFTGLVAPSLKLPGGGLRLLTHLTSLLLIFAVSYAAISGLRFLRDLFLARYDVTATDNLRARKVHTQVAVLEKVLITVIVILTVAFMLMTFDGVRQVGVSLLASAGIAGIILGFAAQKSIGNLLAGIQIAITQPIRIDDVVIVENEWGRIEEITLTYVVVRIWDLRRLVVPINYFIEHPFQNWTRQGSNILGTVYVHTDYTVPVDALREELERLVKPHPLWDGQVCVLHVTDARPETLEIRLLVSTRNSGEGWELRCYVREKMVEFIRKNYPDSLPKTRVAVAEGKRRADGERPATESEKTTEQRSDGTKGETAR